METWIGQLSFWREGRSEEKSCEKPSSASAFTNNIAFKLVEIKHGSGWRAVHVALDQWIKYRSTPDEVVLTIDADNFKEVERQISILKETLDSLRPLAKEMFRQIEEENPLTKR
jgi:hypothetical protein